MMVTIRMRRCAIDQTCHDYVFSDRNHARTWLAPYAEHAAGFRLEEVEAGPWMPCPRCGTPAMRRDVRVIRAMTYAEVMHA